MSPAPDTLAAARRLLRKRGQPDTEEDARDLIARLAGCVRPLVEAAEVHGLPSES